MHTAERRTAEVIEEPLFVSSKQQTHIKKCR